MNRDWSIPLSEKGKPMSRLDELMNMEGFTLHDCIETVGKIPVEITIRISPEEQELTISPWRPLTYSCPKQTLQVAERRDDDKD